MKQRTKKDTCPVCLRAFAQRDSDSGITHGQRKCYRLIAEKWAAEKWADDVFGWAAQCYRRGYMRLKKAAETPK